MRLRHNVAMVLIGTLIMAGCGTYVPEGSTVISVKNSPVEFDRGEIQPAHNELGRQRSIRMKWYDTNTFITTATLEPGRYSFRARNYDGGGFQEDIIVEAEKNLYELDGARKPAADTAAEQQAGPAIAGRVQGYTHSGRGGSVSVLFIGNEIVMRSAVLNRDGSFSVTAPYPGPWRIEVHMLGKPPRSYVHPVTEISAAVDLGTLSLK